MLPDYDLTPLFTSNLLTVENFTCDGRSHAGEEITTRHEIVLPRVGVFTRHARQSVTADANHVVFFNCHTPYRITHPVAGGDCSTLFVLHPTLLAEMIGALYPPAGMHPDCPFPVGHLVIDTRLRIIQYWLLHLTNVPSIESLVLEETVINLIAEVLRAAYHRADLKVNQHVPHPATVRQHRDLVEHAKAHIYASFGEALSLGDLSAALYTSPYHLTRVFKQHTGLPIHAYLRRIRLHHALNALAEYAETPITQIALDCGFASPSHLAAAFSDTFGLSPSAFRRSLSQRSVRELSKILKV